jgi:hypothetical protein
MNPESVRIAATDAAKFLADSQVVLLIDASNSPIVQAFSAVLNSKETGRGAHTLITSLCNCMKSGVINGNALSTVVRGLETFEDNDQESSLKLIQFSAQFCL